MVSALASDMVLTPVTQCVGTLNSVW